MYNSYTVIKSIENRAYWGKQLNTLEFDMTIIMLMGHYTIIRMILQSNTYSIKMESSESRFTVPYNEYSRSNRPEVEHFILKTCALTNKKPVQKLFSVLFCFVVF